MVTPPALRQIFRDDMHEPQWIPLPLEGVSVDEVVIFGNGKDSDLILSLTNGDRIEISVADLRLVTHNGAVVESMRWDDISRTVRITGENLSIRRAAVAWPGRDENIIAELIEEVRTAFQSNEEQRLLGFVVNAELELDHRPKLASRSAS